MHTRVCLPLFVALFAATGCGDKSEEIVGPGSGSGSLTGESYIEEMNTLVSKADTVFKDINDLLAVWNATFNVSYADGKAASLLTDTRALRTQAARLAPPISARQAHITFLSLVDKITSALTSMRSYFATRSDDALLSANVFLREADRLREQYNEQN
jgi:hypothetical protein